MKVLNEKQSAEVGSAVGTVIGFIEAVSSGKLIFSAEQYEKIGTSLDTLSDFSKEELDELVALALKDGAN